MLFMFVTYSFFLNQMNASSPIDFEKIVYPNNHFVNLDYRIEGNQVLFNAYFVNEQKLENQEFDTIDKLIIVKNALLLKDLAKIYDFSLDKNNIIVLNNLDINIIIRDVLVDETNNYLSKVKALLFSLIEPKYSYFDYLNGGFDLAKNNKLLKKYIDVSNIDEFDQLIDFDIANQREIKNNDSHLVRNKIYKYISLVIILLLLIILSLNLYNYHNLKIKDSIKSEFINEEYSKVVEQAKDINIRNLDNQDKYIIATSYVKLESLPNEKKNYILSNISQNTNENILNYWIYLVKDEYNNAYEEAYKANDKDLLVYGYLKEIEYIKNNDKYNASTKEQKIKELESKIEQETKDNN